MRKLVGKCKNLQMQIIILVRKFPHSDMYRPIRAYISGKFSSITWNISDRKGVQLWSSSFQPNRRTVVIFTRLCIGDFYSTHQHIFKDSNAPVCQLCETIVSTEHILVHCPMYLLLAIEESFIWQVHCRGFRQYGWYRCPKFVKAFKFYNDIRYVYLVTFHWWIILVRNLLVYGDYYLYKFGFSTIFHYSLWFSYFNIISISLVSLILYNFLSVNELDLCMSEYYS